MNIRRAHGALLPRARELRTGGASATPRDADVKPYYFPSEYRVNAPEAGEPAPTF